MTKAQTTVVGFQSNLKISEKKVHSPTYVIDDSQIEPHIWEFLLISILFRISMSDLCLLKYLKRVHIVLEFSNIDD